MTTPDDHGALSGAPKPPTIASANSTTIRAISSSARSIGRDGGLALDIELTHYRLEEEGTEAIEDGDDVINPLIAVTGDGTGKAGQVEIPMGLLGELVELFNERFGAGLTEPDAVRSIQPIVDKMVEQQDLREQAVANHFDDFLRGKENIIIGTTMDTQDETSATNFFLHKLLNDPLAGEHATRLVMRRPHEPRAWA